MFHSMVWTIICICLFHFNYICSHYLYHGSYSSVWDSLDNYLLPGWVDYRLGERVNKRRRARSSYKSCDEGFGKLEGVVQVYIQRLGITNIMIPI